MRASAVTVLMDAIIVLVEGGAGEVSLINRMHGSCNGSASFPIGQALWEGTLAS